MDEKSRKLRSLRAWNAIGKIALLGLIAAVVLRAWRGAGGPFAEELSTGIFICAAMFAYCIARIIFFLCPRCGGFFNLTLMPFNKPTGRACGHCGLPAND